MRTITLAEVARRLGVSIPTVRKMADQLPGSVTINRRVRYLEESIAQFVAAGGCKQTKSEGVYHVE